MNIGRIDLIRCFGKRIRSQNFYRRKCFGLLGLMEHRTHHDSTEQALQKSSTTTGSTIVAEQTVDLLRNLDNIPGSRRLENQVQDTDTVARQAVGLMPATLPRAGTLDIAGGANAGMLQTLAFHAMHPIRQLDLIGKIKIATRWKMRVAVFGKHVGESYTPESLFSNSKPCRFSKSK